MEFLMALWLPILVSGIAVFFMSALVWTALPHHRKEYSGLPNDEAMLTALRAGNPAPGMYMIPWFSSQAARTSAEGKARMQAGPMAFVTVIPGGDRGMGPMMAQSLVTNVVIAAFVAYLAWHTVPTGAEYLQVFRIAGTATFMAYGLGHLPDSIWFGRPWSSWFLGAFDALLYALIAGGIFGWLWP
jgi:hypothetical protein